ncbi:MAG: 1-deoxy-D-xylulose-5-phosphate reductoisomerase [Acidiferrobacterales bacterium]
MSTIRGVSILGSTGTIGRNTIDVLERYPDRYQIVALTAHRNVNEMFEQCLKHSPQVAVMRDENAAKELEARLKGVGSLTRVHAGMEGLICAATLEESDTVMAAIVGAAGLIPTLEAVKSGKRVLLANKEPLVMCGHIFIEEAKRSGATLLPIDSEHNAIFQCMPSNYRTGSPAEGVRRILLTCSGGPFRETPADELVHVTPAQACDHPNWNMGRKISVDSATLMNKGLELIEACWLFGVTPDQVSVIVHPQSIIHSMVDYVDGSVLAQMGNPDMRTPIAHALAWPDRIDSGVVALDLFSLNRLDFEEPDHDRFPCLNLAVQAIRKGGTAPAILNAANEVAVEAFLEGRIGFSVIAEVVRYSLEKTEMHMADDLPTILKDDEAARMQAEKCIELLENEGRQRVAKC